MMSNLLKGLILGQSFIIPEGLIPIETPLAPLEQSLSQFNIQNSSLIINSHKISITNNNLSASDEKDSKAGFIIPYDVNPLVYYLNNFEFIVSLILRSDSQATERVRAAAEIIETGRMQI